VTLLVFSEEGFGTYLRQGFSFYCNVVEEGVAL
jgi:hypothetical protein